MAEFKPNKYQQAIYDFILHGEGNAVINAVAGSGKTSTIVNALSIIDSSQSVLFLAFNKSIVDELKGRVGDKPNVQIKTLHSLGSSVCYKEFHSTINSDKYTKYINKCIKEEKYKPTQKLSHTDFLIWKNNIRDICDFGRIELTTEPKALADVATKHDMIILDNEVELAIKAIRWGETNVAEIDFTDMIYFPNVKKMDIPTFDFVFIDECQDLNAAQREFFLKCMDPDFGRFISVGDKNQSIYSFAGADAESFNKLTKLPNTRMLPLSVCYRCDKAIVEKAQKLVPQIEYKDGAEEGVINLEATLDDVKDGDMIICRVSAPLVSLCMKFIKDGIKAYVKGNDTGRSLINTLRRTGEKTVSGAIAVMRSDLNDLAVKICKLCGYDESEATETSMYQTQKDRVDSIAALCEGYDKVEDVINRITRIFSDDNGAGICLSTIHKAKGLENDRVFILNEDKMYPVWAMKNPVQAEQERNLEYVAITRPKKYLGYLTYDCSTGI